MSNTLWVGSSTIEHKILKSCQTIIAAFFPGKKIEISTDSMELGVMNFLEINLSPDEPHTFMFRLLENDQVICLQNINSSGITALDQNCPLPGREPFVQILAKRALQLFLTSLTKQQMPWGILNGIRPGKLVRKMGEMELDEANQDSILQELYMVSEDKTNLLKAIAHVQKPYIRAMQERQDLVSVYLTIPFCPTHCFYCSFPSKQLIPKDRKLLDTYLEALYQELELTGDSLKEMGLQADCIYIGGGTPTILENQELEELLQTIQKHIPLLEQAEYTLEGGRPDTIDKGKLAVMKKYGINRLSINPQTMHDETLNRIGRRHRTEDIIRCFSLARNISDWVINMDLILGLPGESFQEMQESVEKVLALQPDNLTLHALALKKGSPAWENHYSHKSTNNHQDWTAFQNTLQKAVVQAGLIPYYLYRQKYIVGNLENVGYTIPGQECRYNIAMIEEQQNIIGLGAGGSSKILQGSSGHVNLFNPIEINHYLSGFRNVHNQRKKLLQEEARSRPKHDI